jgi:biotin carboxyl carrier protein
MSEDPILDGHPISSLKVVDLRRELDRFGLSKTGVKKELFERLRDHLNSQANGEAQQAEVEEEPEPQVKPSTRSSASPRKSPTKTSPAKAASPTVGF